MKDSYSKAQGDMSPKVESYQKPVADFAETEHSKTLDYIGRQNKFVGREAKKIEKQMYQGRYS